MIIGEAYAKTQVDQDSKKLKLTTSLKKLKLTGTLKKSMLTTSQKYFVKILQNVYLVVDNIHCIVYTKVTKTKENTSKTPTAEGRGSGGEVAKGNGSKN